jgi:hypothetical protein
VSRSINTASAKGPQDDGKRASCRFDLFRTCGPFLPGAYEASLITWQRSGSLRDFFENQCLFKALHLEGARLAKPVSVEITAMRDGRIPMKR